MIRLPKVQLAALFLYFMQYIIIILNWWWFVSYEVPLFGSALVRAHIAFAVMGSILFILIASPFLFWSYRYSNQMPPKTRRNCFFFAVGVAFLTHDFPLWLMEFWMVWQFGWMHVIQGMSIFLLTFTTLVGLFSVWLGYAWKLSRQLQHYFGGPTPTLIANSRMQAPWDAPRI